MKHTFGVKLTAFILMVVLIFLAGSTSFVVLAYSNGGGYLGNGTAFLVKLMENNMWKDITNVYDTYRSLYVSGSTDLQTLDMNYVAYTPENTNFCFRISTKDGTPFYTSRNFSDSLICAATEGYTLTKPAQDVTYTYTEKTFYAITEDACVSMMEDYMETTARKELHGEVSLRDYSFIYNEAMDRYELTAYLRVSPADSIHEIVIHSGIRTDMQAQDQYFQIRYWVSTIANSMQQMIAVIIVCAVLALVLFLYLLCSAGHERGVEGIYVNWFNRIPFDVFVLCVPFPALMMVGVILNDYVWDYRIPVAVLSVLILTLSASLLALSVLSFAVRVKNHNVLRNTLCYRVAAFFYRNLRDVVETLHLFPKVGIIWFSICAVELFVIGNLAEREPFLIVLAFLEKCVMTIFLARVVLDLRKLELAGQAIAQGDLSYKTDLRHMLPTLKKHGENLNHIGEGMKQAVAEQTKSERMKAELITNVSHDLKTPLTSIINYVDLLKKEPAGSEAAAGYIEVLDRQASRMKKLTEDLVEASKASSGAMPVSISPTNLNLLLSQSLAEYADKLEARNLTPVFTPGEDIPEIPADGRLLWRVFDNLLGNICKYAMPGTRIYVSSELGENKIRIAFKNISNEPLNITADELMERFVRGDASRSTEGSGLGLSIAKSLLELMHGSLNLLVDGDLFKAEITLPCQ